MATEHMTTFLTHHKTIFSLTYSSGEPFQLGCFTKSKFYVWYNKFHAWFHIYAAGAWTSKLPNLSVTLTIPCWLAYFMKT